MTELRDAVAAIIWDHLRPEEDTTPVADAILAIPQLERAGEAVARLRDLFKRIGAFRGAGPGAELALTQLVAAELKSLEYLLEKVEIVPSKAETVKPLNL